MKFAFITKAFRAAGSFACREMKKMTIPKACMLTGAAVGTGLGVQYGVLPMFSNAPFEGISGAGPVRDYCIQACLGLGAIGSIFGAGTAIATRDVTDSMEVPSITQERVIKNTAIGFLVGAVLLPGIFPLAGAVFGTGSGATVGYVLRSTIRFVSNHKRPQVNSGQREPNPSKPINPTKPPVDLNKIING